jgi:hypothetical protein
MTEFSTLLQQGAANAWLFIPSATLVQSFSLVLAGMVLRPMPFKTR